MNKAVCQNHIEITLMDFLKGFIRNIAILTGIGLIIYLIEPDMVRQVIEAYWLIFGPIALLLLVVAALPQRKGKKR